MVGSLSGSSLKGGRVLGAYVVKAQLGTGPRGAVQLAVDTALQRTVVIRSLHVEDDLEGALLTTLVGRAHDAARVAHENLARVLDVITRDGTLHIVSEHVDGDTLEASTQARGGRLDERVGLLLMRRVAEGLASLNALGVAHGRVTSTNLMLSRTGDLKLTDLGAPPSDPRAGVRAPTAPDGLGHALTTTAPEVWGGSTPAPASDVYALGCLFYRLLVGSYPFARHDARAALVGHCHEAPPDPRALHRALSNETTFLLQRCLAKAPRERPTATQLIGELDDVLTTEHDPPARSQRSPTPRPSTVLPPPPIVDVDDPMPPPSTPRGR